MKFTRRIFSNIARAKHVILRWHGLQLQRIYRLLLWSARYKVVTVIVFLMMGSSYFLLPLQGMLEPYFLVEERFSEFKILLVTVGGSLIGATAIAFSFAMFAMQINVERMPHGLFRKLSGDFKLLGAFAGIFLIAIAILTISLIPDTSWIKIATLIAFWGVVWVMLLLFYAYRRALRLVNPMEQLGILVNAACRNSQVWARRAQRATPLVNGSIPEQESSSRFVIDFPRFIYFQHHPHWTRVSRQAILYAVSYARRYAERGDYEVAGYALGAVIAVNKAYVKAKGKTFFPENPIFHSPAATDGFINDTLEHLRQNVKIGVSRGDEQQIEQTFLAMYNLCKAYLDIECTREYAPTTHANLAVGYLCQAVESVVPHNMPDVLMEGVRLIGQAGQCVLSKGQTDEVATISGKIGVISCCGAMKKDYYPVTQVGMEQLAKLTLWLIRSESHDIRSAAREIKNNVRLITKFFLNLPDTPLSNTHSYYLGYYLAPYYSGTNTETLQCWLTDLVNALMELDADDEVAQRLVRHIAQWAEGLYETEREVFLATMEKKSSFTFDIIHWISHITKLLLTVSNAPACDARTREKIREHAHFLIWSLSWVPDDKETISFVENYQITEALFDVAVDAHNRNCKGIANDGRDILLSWAFKAGKYTVGQRTFEQACYGLVTLNIILGYEDSVLVNKFSECLTKINERSQENCDHVARKIREYVKIPHGSHYTLSRIENSMGRIDQEKLYLLLGKIADLFSPNSPRIAD